MGKAKNLVRESDQRQGSAIVGVNVKAQVNSRLIWLCPHFLSEKSTLPSGCGSFHKTASCDALRLSNHFAFICGCLNILNIYSTTQVIPSSNSWRETRRCQVFIPCQHECWSYWGQLSWDLMRYENLMGCTKNAWRSLSFQTQPKTVQWSWYVSGFQVPTVSATIWGELQTE